MALEWKPGTTQRGDVDPHYVETIDEAYTVCRVAVGDETRFVAWRRPRRQLGTRSTQDEAKALCEQDAAREGA